jgi:hypothetical protein
MMLAFNPSTGRQKQANLYELQVISLVYEMSVPGQPELHRETLSRKTNKQTPPPPKERKNKKSKLNKPLLSV